MCRNSTANVIRNEAIYINTGGAPEFAAVECICTLTKQGTGHMKILYTYVLYVLFEPTHGQGYKLNFVYSIDPNQPLHQQKTY